MSTESSTWIATLRRKTSSLTLSSSHLALLFFARSIRFIQSYSLFTERNSTRLSKTPSWKNRNDSSVYLLDRQSQYLNLLVSMPSKFIWKMLTDLLRVWFFPFKHSSNIALITLASCPNHLLQSPELTSNKWMLLSEWSLREFLAKLKLPKSCDFFLVGFSKEAFWNFSIANSHFDYFKWICLSMTLLIIVGLSLFGLLRVALRFKVDLL